MESKYNFKELMKERHSCRRFQSKKIPEEVLKDIITISLDSPSWCNSQPWNIYIATGNTLEEIRKEWKAKKQAKVKGYADISHGHRTDFSERLKQQCKYFSKHGINYLIKMSQKNQLKMGMDFFLSRKCPCPGHVHGQFTAFFCPGRVHGQNCI